MKLIHWRTVLICIFFFMLMACKQKTVVSLEGFIDADYTYIASNLSGHLTQLFVHRGDKISKDQLLFTLDAKPQSYELENAQANVNRAMSEVKKQQLSANYYTTLFERYQKLIKGGGISKEEFDLTQKNYKNALAALNVLNANLQSAKIKFEKAKWNKTRKMVMAPIAGSVYDTFYTMGEFIPAGHAVLSLLAYKNLKVVFYSPEPLLSSLHINQSIRIACDGCKEPLSAVISFISPRAEYTPPFIYSEQERSKLIYRIEARLVEPNPRLNIGQPVSVRLELK